MSAVTLPELAQSAWNHSSRMGAPIRAVCVHRWGITDTAHERIAGIDAEFKNPASQASAHIAYAGEVGPDAGKAIQGVRIADKAWACEFYNPITINLEFGDRMWFGEDPDGFARAERIVGWFCKTYKILPRWQPNPTQGQGGICRHFDLGALGGGHTDPTTDLRLWMTFMRGVQAEVARDGYRKTWAR